jgi:hypothetical protein
MYNLFRRFEKKTLLQGYWMGFSNWNRGGIVRDNRNVNMSSRRIDRNRGGIRNRRIGVRDNRSSRRIDRGGISSSWSKYTSKFICNGLQGTYGYLE